MKQMVKIELGKITEKILSTPKMEVYTIDDMTEKQLMLYIACREGDGTLIRDYLRENNLYTNIIDNENKRTLIHYTAEKNLALCTDLLISKLKSEGFNDLKKVLNIQDREGNTPLHLALLNGEDEKLIQVLVENGANIYLKNNNNKSVLELAKESNVIEIYDYFSNLNKKQTGKIELGKITTKNILSLPRMREYRIDDMGENQLMLYIACREGDKERIRECLKKDNLYTNIIDKENGKTLIHYTAEKNLALSTNLLIKKLKREGFKNLRRVLNIRDKEGNTPLHLALLNSENIKLIQILVKNGANINLTNSENKSALKLAQESNAVEIIKYFYSLDKKQMSLFDSVKMPQLSNNKNKHFDI